MNANELKELNLTEFNSDEMLKHIETVKSLDKDEKKDYLLFALDNYYSLDEQHSKEIEMFFTNDDFKQIYVELMEENSNETDI